MPRLQPEFVQQRVLPILRKHLVSTVPGKAEVPILKMVDEAAAWDDPITGHYEYAVVHHRNFDRFMEVRVMSLQRELIVVLLLLLLLLQYSH